jgi:acyl-CoA thioesterase-1
MRPAIVLLLLWVAAASPARSAAPPVILVLGDSLSAGYGLAPGQGWVSLLQQRLKKEGYGHRVVNASVSGETTDGGLARLDRALATHKPGIVVLELGANDGLRGLPVSRVETNLGLLITKSRAAGAEVLLLTVRMPTNYGAQYTSSYQKIYDDLRKRYRISVAAIMSPEMALDLSYFLDDGIHPNARAQPLLLDNVWGQLTPLLRR